MNCLFLKKFVSLFILPLLGLLSLHAEEVPSSPPPAPLVIDGIPANQVQLVLIGDSITDDLRQNKKPLHEFQPVWQKYYAPYKALNLGVSGNKTSDVLNRINNGMLDHIKPRVAMLMIGTNNTGAGESVEDTVKGIQSVVDKIHEKLPSTRILLLNILPNDIRDWHVRGAQDPKEKWLKDREINKQINAFYANSSFVTCLNLEKVFLNKDGSINETLYYDPQEVNFLGRKCGPLHPSTAGHTLMAEAIKPVLKKLMEKPALSPEQ